MYKGHKGGIWDLAFSPIEKILASASGDRTIKLWNLADGSCINTLCGHMQSVLRLYWINKGMQMVSSGADGLIKVWNLVKSENIATYNEHDEGKVWALAYSETEGKIFSGGSDSKVLQWDDVTAEVEKSEFEKRKEQIAEEQKLANLGHEGNVKDAAILAFKLGKVKDFVAYLENLLISNTAEASQADPVAAILEDQREFSALFDSVSVAARTGSSTLTATSARTLLKEIVQQVAEINLARLMDIIKDCNTKSHYALLAQTLLYCLINETDLDALKEAAKKTVERGKTFGKKPAEAAKSLPEIIDVLIAYTERHATRIDKFLKFSCFIDYLAQKMDIVTEDVNIMKP